MKQAAQGNRGALIPGDNQEACGCGTEGHGPTTVKLMAGLDDLEDLCQLRWFYASKACTLLINGKRKVCNIQPVAAHAWLLLEGSTVQIVYTPYY